MAEVVVVAKGVVVHVHVPAQPISVVADEFYVFLAETQWCLCDLILL
jgi:hypothetical protein